MPTYNFESQKKSARNLVLSANKQLTIGEVMSDANLTRRQRFDGSAVAEIKQTRRSDKDMSGKGTEFATDGQVTGWDTSFSFRAELDDWLAAWAFAFAMGKDTVTGAGPYTHTIAFDETTTQAPVTNVYLEDTTALKTKYQDMAITDLTLTIPQRGALSVELALAGTGRWSNVAMGAAPAVPVNNYLLGSDCVFSMGATGALNSLIGRHLASTVKLSTGVASHTAPGGGLFGLFMRTGLRKVSLSTTIAAKDTEDIHTLLENDTLQEAKWVTASGAVSLTIDAPAVKWKAVKLGTQNNMTIWQLDADETSMFNLAGAGVINVTVLNSLAALLVGA